MTLSPFPSSELKSLVEKGVGKLVVVELNAGQMMSDVKLAVEGRSSVEFIHRVGGLLPASSDIVRRVEMISR